MNGDIDIDLEDKQNQYLNRLVAADRELKHLAEKHARERFQQKEKFARLYEEARLEADITVKDVADRLGKTRQSVHQVIVEVFGVRHPDKVKAAQIGHKNREAAKNN